MIAVLGHHDLGQKPRRDEAAFEERRRQRRDHRHGIEQAALHILGPHRAPPQEASWFIVQPLADFFTDAPPLLGSRLHRRGDEHFFNDLQMLRYPWPPGARRRWSPRALWGLRGHRLRGFSRSVESLQKQQQLRRIELLALGSKEPPGQRVDLLAQERVLLFQKRQPFQQRGGIRRRVRLRHSVITIDIDSC